MKVSEAEGFAELGLWREAWDTIEELPPEEKATPAALRVRLRCCPGLGAWDIGEHVAGLLRDGKDADKETAAKFFHALATFHVRAGQTEGAKQAVRNAIETWPDIRIVLMDDPALGVAIFGG